uniref:C3H1-type domain-containing protein n=1 Tax=Noctiluca scintillans TaxID=2966 RepID=A0A7S0ZNS3_NOCSC|mmetsp:Transcript_12680/g.35066  ORF Transcript_12680/g.35066 Transcript_12680/m.35066 type:complete len:393 (+) Transcript_12680:121-1299(+)|eukprot:CAMPEP_0194516902 /NCGR_PEP_ID=MMETSP0253-20130528/49938_1 /TAXON_ID=2966 /ORGANISM="Noctiluca scintillans" /LENGTH=392 /DNA_ID=CAMNT_0039360815 /DNA_START=38 /DNA_END=1216 /DNA_ORIENTATION=+
MPDAAPKRLPIGSRNAFLDFEPVFSPKTDSKSKPKSSRKSWADASGTPTASPWARDSTPTWPRPAPTPLGAYPGTPDAWPMDYRLGFPGFPMPGVPMSGCMPAVPSMNPMLPGSMVSMMPGFGMPMPGLMMPNFAPAPMMVQQEPMSVEADAGEPSPSKTWPATPTPMTDRLAPYSFNLEVQGLPLQSSPGVENGNANTPQDDAANPRRRGSTKDLGQKLRAEISGAERLEDVSNHSSLTVEDDDDEELSPDMPKSISMPEVAKRLSPKRSLKGMRMEPIPQDRLLVVRDGQESISDEPDDAVIPTKCPPGVPSRGSTWHGSGKCRPCAWFWKSKGCTGDQDCQYCHLCPEGELKARKKAKVAAMRMGALAPAPKDGNAAPRVLRLTPLLKS